jgi:hypothetical protein
MYDPTLAGETERRLSLEWIARTLPMIRAVLVKADATLEPQLAKLL